jgi:ribose transport system substrate-binding protein
VPGPEFRPPGVTIGPMNKPKFVLSLITRENDYQREQARSAETAAQRLNVDLQILYADNDSVAQSSQLLEALHKYKSELKGILVEPAGGTEFPQVGNAAVNAGVAWVILNRTALSLSSLKGKSAAPVFAVSSDHVEVGRMQAAQLAAFLPQGGTVLFIQGPSGSMAAQGRTTGIQQARPENLTLKILKSSNWTEEAGYHAVASWLRLSISRQQPIHAVAGQNDSIALGARRAFDEIRSQADAMQCSDLPFLGIDGLPRTGQSSVHAGALAATIIVPVVAAPALEIAVKALASGIHPNDLHLIKSVSFPALETLRPQASTHKARALGHSV